VSKTNRNLLVLAAVLFLISVLTYRQSVSRADRFQRGQVFLPSLNPDEVASIQLVKQEETVTLERQGDRFTVAEKEGYPASNASVNRFLRDVLEIGLEREVGRGEGLAEELAIEPPGEETVEVALSNAAGQQMVRFRVTKQFDDGPGNYVQRRDDEEAPIYLTSRAVYLTSDVGSFLDKEIVDHPRSEVRRVEGVDFVLAKPEDAEDLELVDLAAGRPEKRSELNRLQTVLSGLRFDEVFLANDPEVQDLEFEQTLSVELDDGSGYALSHAGKDDRHFLRIRGFSPVEQVAISRDESEEELKEKAELLTRADEIDEFNEFHGSWVYEISEWTAEKLLLRRSNLIDTESS
jgi:hypothetical protein